MLELGSGESLGWIMRLGKQNGTLDGHYHNCVSTNIKKSQSILSTHVSSVDAPPRKLGSARSPFCENEKCAPIEHRLSVIH